MRFPGNRAELEIHRGSFREGGLPHQLLVITDLSDVLREEERKAWQRLIRVMGHELNNSLAPMKSIAENLGSMLRPQRPQDWEEDMRSGLGIIASRTDGLARFMNAYARLAKLPPPVMGPVVVSEWIRRVVGLEARAEVRLVAGPEIQIQADADQLDQLLINLLRNAVDAALETGGGVYVGWRSDDRFVEVWVRDEGPGIPEPGESVCAVFYYQAWGIGDRVEVLPADR